MTEKIMDRFNEFLRNELSAVETYEMALKQAKHTGFVEALRQLRDDHAQRTAGLRDKIREIGGTPTGDSGAWGVWAKTVQAGADLLGNKTAIAALEQGEDHGLKLYTDALGDESGVVRDYVSSVLIPLQQKTHEQCRSLKSFVKKAA
jgi:bacterioferritin (cytochrome b1)